MKSTKQRDKLAATLEKHVRTLTDLGERSVRRPEALETAAEFIESQFKEFGYETIRQTYEAGGIACSNIEASMRDLGTDRPHLLIGAHYDSAEGTPGADDNASAIAIMLELANRLKKTTNLPVRFVAFVNEEPPFFQTPLMGSAVFAARASSRRENISGMICLESLGIFLSEPGSQILPPQLPKAMGLMPEKTDLSKGNFVAVIGNEPSKDLMVNFACMMRCHMRGIPLTYAEMPDMELSDHLAFWAEGFPAVMVTDTAFLRNQHYHLASDTPERLNYLAMTEVLRGLEGALSIHATSMASPYPRIQTGA